MVHFIYKQYDPHTQTVNTVNVPVLDVQQSSLVDISFNNVTVKNIVKNICEDRAQTKLTKAPSNASFIWNEDLSVIHESSQTINYCFTDGDKDFSEASHIFNSSQSEESEQSFESSKSSQTINYCSANGDKDFSEASHSFNSSQNEESEQSFESNDTISYSQNNSYIESQEQSSSESTVNDSIVSTSVNKCKCIYTNADQLQNKLDELYVQCVILDADFIFVTEVLPKFNLDNISCASMIYHIDGYKAFHRSDNGRGVIIYAKDTYNISPNQYLNSIMMLHGATGLLTTKR